LSQLVRQNNAEDAENWKYAMTITMHATPCCQVCSFNCHFLVQRFVNTYKQVCDQTKLRKLNIYISRRSQDSSVGIATRLRAGRHMNWGSIPGKANRFISSGAIPEFLHGEVERRGRKDAHTPLSSAEVKNIYTFITSLRGA
jgi:hypothetical protein